MFFHRFFQRSVVNYYCSDKQDFQRSFERAPNVKIVSFIKSQNIFDLNNDLVTINYVICFSIFWSVSDSFTAHSALVSEVVTVFSRRFS